MKVLPSADPEVLKLAVQRLQLLPKSPSDAHLQRVAQELLSLTDKIWTSHVVALQQKWNKTIIDNNNTIEEILAMLKKYQEEGK